ncbi:MAG: protein kinase [Myxococcaceae bacterium]|nr:protein kinase [Myxococcaceae bacterium]MCA3013993.1 protein kinase [Myxococcaceae bacterium]
MLDSQGVTDARERYVFVKHLAEGGMADVFLARDTGTTPPRLVVVKRLLAEFRAEPDRVAMFLDESDLAVRLVHPNIVRAFDRGSTREGPFLVLEYLAGYDVDLVIERLRKTGGQMPWELVVRVMAAVARGMACAHELKGADGAPLNLAHRDLTPSNIFITFDGVVKVLDFGIAKAGERRTRTATGMLKGKARYLAPEQIRGLPNDGRVDQFALGAALFEALTLRPLFEGDNELAIIHAIVEKPRPRLSVARPEVPPQLDEVFERLLAQRPEDRFPSMNEVAAALEAIVTQPGAEAGEPGRWRTDLSDFMRQHFGADFEAHASLMGRLASTSTSELKAFFEKGERPDEALEAPARLEKTLIAPSDAPGAGARANAAPPLRLPDEPPARPLALPDEAMNLPELLPATARPTTRRSEVRPAPGGRGPLLALALGALALLLGVGVVRARRPSAPATGSLLVRSTPPGATIELDGRPLPGRTPTAITDLSPGRHLLVVSHPDAVQLSLPTDVLAEAQATVDVILPSREGTVTLEVSPATALALVDGRELPLDAGVGRSEPLTAGRHEVVVRALGYQQKVLEVAVEDQRHESLRVELVPEPPIPGATPPPPVEPR